MRCAVHPRWRRRPRRSRSHGRCGAPARQLPGRAHVVRLVDCGQPAGQAGPGATRGTNFTASDRLVVCHGDAWLHTILDDTGRCGHVDFGNLGVAVR